MAENSGGVHCLKYGLTIHNVLRAKVVTIDDDIIELGSEAPDAPGLDLLSVFIGSEGMLGVVTDITVKLIPKPARAQVIIASFASVDAAGNAVTQIIAASIIPAGLEMMDQRTVQMVEPFVQVDYDVRAQAILLCESDGTRDEVQHEIARMENIFRQAGATCFQVSQSEQERLLF